jgi:hypothetical protein
MLSVIMLKVILLSVAAPTELVELKKEIFRADIVKLF